MGGLRFVADSMTGKLARWLRVLGYDTHYQRRYGPGELEKQMKGGRILLTRHKKRAENLGSAAVLVHGNGVDEQLTGLKAELHLDPDPSCWFRRCIICNEPLMPPPKEMADQAVPEYVLYHNRTDIRFCPSCGRYFWPGSHRARMVERLRQWGFSREKDAHPNIHPHPV